MGAFNTVLNDTVYGKAFVTRDIPIFFTPAGDVGYPYPTYPDITELYFVLTAHLYKFSGGVDCRTNSVLHLVFCCDCLIQDFCTVNLFQTPIVCDIDLKLKQT